MEQLSGPVRHRGGAICSGSRAVTVRPESKKYVIPGCLKDSRSFKCLALRPAKRGSGPDAAHAHSQEEGPHSLPCSPTGPADSVEGPESHPHKIPYCSSLGQGGSGGRPGPWAMARRGFGSHWALGPSPASHLPPTPHTHTGQCSGRECAFACSFQVPLAGPTGEAADQEKAQQLQGTGVR